MDRRIILVFVLAVAAVALFVLAGAVASADGVTDIGTDHDLDNNSTIDAYDREGYVETSVQRYQLGLEVAENGRDVGLEPSLARDTRNDFLRLTYDEDFERTFRILVPREYITPYTMDSVEAIDSDHTASYEPVRGNEYLAVTITFDGKGEAVLPLQKDSAVSYGLIEKVDDRVEQVSGVSIFGRGSTWHYIRGDEAASQAAYPLNASSDDELLIQYDARPDSPEELWVNAPRGEHDNAPMYYFDRESDDQVYLVVDNETAPTVRYNTNASTADRVRGDVNDIRLVPDRVRDRVGDIIPFL